MTPREEVLEALASFASRTDSRDWDGLRDMLTDDAQAYGADGGDATITRMQDFLGGVGPSQHLLGNHRITFDGNPGIDGTRASSQAYGRIHHVGAGAMTGSSYECLGEYSDTWVRSQGRWLLAQRWFAIKIEIGEIAVLGPAE